MKRFLASSLLLLSLLGSSLFAPAQDVVRRPIVASGDPNFSNVKLLLHLDGTDGATTSTDSSASGHTLTFNSGAQLDTAQFKFGTASLLLALTDDTVTIPDSDDFHFGLQEDFTIESFVRWNNKDSNSGNQIIVSQYNNVGNQRSWYLRLTGGNQLTFFASGDGSTTGFLAQGSFTPSNDTWYYIVVERVGTTVRIAAGTSGTPTTVVTDTNALNDDELHNSTQAVMIGAFNSSGVVQECDCWIDETRITTGVTRYGGTYSVPTAAFPDN